MFVVKLRTPSRANYEHFHVYLAYSLEDKQELWWPVKHTSERPA